MPNLVVVGAQWGDEGKAKVTDLLAERADWVVRSQGGCNAGHTVCHQGQVYKFHLIPSGILYPGKRCVIGAGVVIDPDRLLAEIQQLTERGIDLSALVISERAHLTLPVHIEQDRNQEAQLADGKIGTTGRGIGPTYQDKVARHGIRLADLLEEDAWLRQRLTGLATVKAQAGWVTDIDATVADWMTRCASWRTSLSPYIADTVALLDAAHHAGDTLLFEGAQGTLLDIDFGTYPFVTSSNATAGGACTGSGIGPTRVDHVLGVMKAYITRVGSGPFPTELTDAQGDYLVETGHEFGTTTGRRRRCGWFDAVAGRFAVQVNGLDSVAITKLDVLDGLSEIPICVGYRDEATGRTLDQFPSRLSVLGRVTPVYDVLPGWQTPLTQCTEWADLPPAARRYLERLETLLGVPVQLVGVGPDREQTLFHPNIRWTRLSAQAAV